ncbi:hypothetical protein BDR04DRAFT_1102342 [Suillus decipiens]|nr:hypothetical protein BDR04DRAFT_1102342 [Suillus decipiens]
MCTSHSFTHYATYPLLSLQSDATRRPPAGQRKPPIYAIPIAPRPLPTREPRQAMFLRLRKLLRCSSRANTVHSDRNNQSQDSLDVSLFLLFLLQLTQQSYHSSLPHCPYLAIAILQKVLHPLPYLVAGPSSIPSSRHRTRASKGRASRDEKLPISLMFLSDKLPTFVFYNSIEFVSSDPVIL